MNVIEELRTFTDTAHKAALDMIQIVDAIKLETTTHEKGAKDLDLAARELIAIAETVKDLAYRLKRGETRVTKFEVAS